VRGDYGTSVLDFEEMRMVRELKKKGPRGVEAARKVETSMLFY
jgi:hypothetical protein